MELQPTVEAAENGAQSGGMLPKAGTVTSLPEQPTASKQDSTTRGSQPSLELFEKLIQTAFEQAKAFVALQEAREEIEYDRGAGKPWYDGDEDTPEGLFALCQEFPECEWLLGNASDVSATSSEDDDAEEDAEEEDVEQ